MLELACLGQAAQLPASQAPWTASIGGSGAQWAPSTPAVKGARWVELLYSGRQKDVPESLVAWALQSPVAHLFAEHCITDLQQFKGATGPRSATELHWPARRSITSVSLGSTTHNFRPRPSTTLRGYRAVQSDLGHSGESW